MADAYVSADDLPDGEYAIVEALGHRTLIGRVAEVERFGTKMLQVEPLFGPSMLGAILLGGSSIYQFTPCTKTVAFERRPTATYQLPASILSTVPPALLPQPSASPYECDEDERDDFEDGSYA